MIALLFVGLFAIPLALLASPRRWLGFVVGVAVLFGGVAWLDLHTTPSWDQDFGYAWASGILSIWGFVTLAIGLLRLLVGQKSSDPRGSRLDWTQPMAVLVAVFFMHWLRNRLAGVSPGWLPHLGIIGGSLLVSTILVAQLRKAKSDALDLRVTAIAFSIAVAVLALGDAYDASTYLRMARTEAAGRNFCIMTLAGNEKYRPARSVFDVSPLISRYQGKSFIGHGSWLIVQDGKVFRFEGLRNAYGRRPYFSNDEIRAGVIACRPTPGGF